MTGPEFEKKILLDVVEQMRDFETTSRKQTVLRRIVLACGAIGMVIAFFAAIIGLLHPVGSTFIAGFSGAALGFGLYLDFTKKQWPITRNHIDMESVRKRLDELGAAPRE